MPVIFTLDQALSVVRIIYLWYNLSILKIGGIPMNKHPKVGHRVSIVIIVTCIVVIASSPLIRFSGKVLSIANRLDKISQEISELEYRRATWFSGYDYNADIKKLYDERNSIANSDSIANFLVTSSGTDDSATTRQNRENRMLLIISCLVLLILLCFIDIALVLLSIIYIIGYARTLWARFRRNARKVKR